jgi:Ca-activated chloride channel family protein
MSTRHARFLVLGIVATAFLAAADGRAARGQGILIDRRPHVALSRSYNVRDVDVDARIRDQVAEVRVSQTFHNPGSSPLEAEFTFPLPEEGTIQSFVLLVDGREWPGRILPKDEARRVYEEIVRTKRDPALLEYMGRGLYRTSVFPIPPGADRKVTMRYTQICRRERDVVEFSVPFGTQKFTAKPIERLSLRVDIESRDPIKSVYSPGDDLAVERRGEHAASVSQVLHQVVPAADFRLVYTLAEGALGASVLSVRPSAGEDGYFLLLASPQVARPGAEPGTRARAKTVVCVLDRSGSMAGKKLEQARRALRFVLDNLRDDDTFNIIAYDDRVDLFRPELVRYSSRTREEAARFVDNIREGGSTDINAALQTALRQVPDDSRPSYVLFLTDGLPTAGETNEMAIAENCRKANGRRARVFAFGVGFDVNARLLDRLSGGNSGTSTFVKPDEDIEAQVARFYSRLTSPVLADLRLEFEGTDVNRLYPRDLPDLFEGGELIVAGRYRDSGRTTLRLTGRVGDERRRFEFPVELAPASGDRSHDYVERLWAVRRVGFIIDQVDLHGRSKELIDELLALSTRYGILTPYTSFLADERVPLHARRENADRTLKELESLESLSGAQGVGQRAVKGMYQEARQSGGALAGAPRMLSPVPAAVAANPTAPAGAAGPAIGLMGGMGGMNNSGQSPALPAVQFRRKAAPGARTEPGFALALQGTDGRNAIAETVRQVGAKSFYFKDDGWIDATVTADEAAGAIKIAQFSDEFFGLTREQSAEENRYLTFNEPVTVRLGRQVYRVEPGSPK